jgi:hypothetical protein
MRTPIRRRTIRLASRPAAALVPALALTLALTAPAGPVVAKEGFQARLDAPIARDTPGGTTLLVGMTVTFPDGPVDHPVEGSPIYLELVGRDDSSVIAMGREDATRGHYLARIEVPASGVSSVEIGVRGTSNLPIIVLGATLVPGGIGARTAQVAPALALAPTPFARASVAPPAVAPPAVAPAVAPADEPAVQPSATPATSAQLLAAVGLLGLLLGIVLTLVAVRRPRSSGHPRVTEPVPEA